MKKLDSLTINNGKQLPLIKNHFLNCLFIGFEVVGIRIRETIIRSYILWYSIYFMGLLLERFGKKVQAARLFAAGQRSAPQDLRTLFGKIVTTKIDAVMSIGGEPPIREIFLDTRVCVLKPYIGKNEKGVLHIMFSEVISALPKHIDLNTLNNYFRLVLEPSWTGLCYPGILQYADASCKNIIMAPDPADFSFIESLKSQLVPISLGSADWVDPKVAEPFLGIAKNFDIVMNASWAPWKRHHVLFSAMRQMKTKPKVALIGVSWDGGDLDRIARLANFYGVSDDVTVFERIPFWNVMDVVCRSRCCVLLSLKEGANRALTESMFCDTPALLLAEYIGGAEKNIVPQTGLIVPEYSLAQSLEQVISGKISFAPREWALKHISCMVSTRTLNLQLRAVAEKEGEAWTQDIVTRSNSPESKYLNMSDEAALAQSNDAVSAFLRKKSSLPITNDVCALQG